ncbi:hypothetical protein LTR08_001915 [Meristemomyces frigidus]|nr:hypothetical protein LTR08_001915 [Meristemomyces frigidus]
MDAQPAPTYKIALTAPTAKEELCCDAAHKNGIFIARYGCTSPKLLYVWCDGSFAYVHASVHVAPGYSIRPATVKTKRFVRAKEVEAEAKISASEAKIASSSAAVIAQTINPVNTGAATGLADGTMGPGTATKEVKTAPISNATSPAVANVQRGSTLLAVGKKEQQVAAVGLTSLSMAYFAANHRSQSSAEKADKQYHGWDMVEGFAVAEDTWAIVDADGAEEEDYDIV